jgi:hypothetical protein
MAVKYITVSMMGWLSCGLALGKIFYGNETATWLNPVIAKKKVHPKF